MALKLSQILENFQNRLGTDAIDEFRYHLEASLKRNRNSLQNEYDAVTEGDFGHPCDIEDYNEMLHDQFFMLDEVKKLADELSLSALFKHVELHTKRVIKRHMPSIDQRKLFNIKSLKSALPFKLEEVDEYDAFNELRLINNSIKHNGNVSDELEKEFSSWVEGEKLENLEIAYLRLQPRIKKYVSSLVSNIANHTELKPNE